MPGRKRQCSNCRHYEDAGHSKNGWCSHPNRKTTSGAMLLVRGGELACRNQWGSDLFESRDGNDESRAPAPSTPPPGTPPPATDDRVTSVVTPPTRGVDAGGEDRVVSDRPAPRRDQEDPNGAALLEQAERAKVMARGNGPALARARQRHLDRQRGERLDAPDPAAEPAAPGGGDSRPPDITHHTNEPRAAVVTQRARMDRRVSASGSTDLIGIDQPVPRSEVRQRLPDLANDPRYSSVPAIDPDFDLPLSERDAGTLHGALAPQDLTPEGSTPGTGGAVEPAPTSYEHVLNRARRTREEKHYGRPIRLRPARAPQSETTSIRDHERMAEPPHPSAEPIDPWRARGDRPDYDENERAEVEEDLFDRDTERRWSAADEAQDEVLVADTLPPYPEHPPLRRRRNWFGNLGRRRVDRENHDHAAQVEDVLWNAAPHGVEPVAEADEDDPWLDDGEPRTADTGDDRRHDSDAAWPSPDARSPRSHEPNPVGDPASGPTFRATFPVAATHDAYQDERSHHIPTLGRSDRNRALLPDLDDLLATASPHRDPTSGADVGSAPAGDRHDRDPAPVPVEESRSSRWMSPSPSTSALRASNFRDWPGGGPIRAADWDGEGDAPAELAEDDALPLPDLDAGRFDLRELVERGGELLDMEITVAREVPRECRTCRSFHSAEGGARGWCMNPWAFTHRRMVNEEDLACDSTIGCWWLPDNRFWMLENGAVSGNATPLMDAFMARIATRPERKVSTS